jgi:hypothetical protein
MFVHMFSAHLGCMLFGGSAFPTESTSPNSAYSIDGELTYRSPHIRFPVDVVFLHAQALMTYGMSPVSADINGQWKFMCTCRSLSHYVSEAAICDTRTLSHRYDDDLRCITSLKFLIRYFNLDSILV